MKNFNHLNKQKLKRVISIFMFQFVMLLLLLPNLLKAQTIGSSADNPFPISTVLQLASLAEQVNEGGVFYYEPTDGKYYDQNATGRVAIANMAEGAYFKLMNDIVSNAGDVASCDGVKASGWYPWTMIGIEGHPFDGYFDGDFHTVSGVLINSTGNCHGFFGALANHAEIKNLGVVNSYISGTDAVGGIVGEALGGTIENCFFIGTIETSGNYTGGLVGQMSVGTKIIASYASATISTSGNQLGGIVGKILNSPQDCELQNVYSSCILHGNFQYTGGIAGENLDAGTVFSNCYFDQQLIDCKVTPNPDPHSTAAGTAMPTTAMTNGTWAPTGFTPAGSGQYPYITGFPISNDAVLFSTVPIFLPVGTSLSDLSNVNTVTVGAVAGVTWTEIERVGVGSFVFPTLSVTGQSYVVLKATKGSNSRTYVLQFDKAPYLGTAENPFPINNQTDLTNFRDGINNGMSFAYKHYTIPVYGENTNFIQTANIAMPSGNNISNTESRAFKGTYDGGNHKITSLTKDGFFGYTKNATVKNLTVERSSSTKAALIYSMAGGTVDNCHSTGSVSTTGGLIWETAVVSGTSSILNSTNRNNCSGVSGECGGIVCQVGTSENYLENCHNYGNISGSYRVGGLVGRSTQNATAHLTVMRCSNRGNVTNPGTGNEAVVGGLVGKCSATITYSYNMGDVDGRANTVAGITASGSASYCYNLGTITGGKNTSGARNLTVNGISSSAPSKCFNAGMVVNYSTGHAYALSSSGSTDCFNAGDIAANAGNAYSANSGTNTYTIGRLVGNAASIGGNYYDPARVPSFTTANSSTAKTTAQMTNGSLSMGANWVGTAGLYPRILGLDTCMASYAVALPITFGVATDNVDHVSADFTIANAQGILWRVEGTSGATIAVEGNHQKVTLPSDRTGGNIILAAYKGSETYYRITLKMAVEVPSAVLTVTSFADLQTLQSGINSGTVFNYKGTAVPAGGKGTTFQVTTDFSFPANHNWTPIGSEVNPFKGTFDGNGKTLTGMSQSGQNITGLFGYVTGAIKNLTLAEVKITGATYSGNICAFLRGGAVSNCKTSGTVKGGSSQYHTHKYIGGIVGLASQGATIKNCYNFADVTSSDGVYASAAGIVADCSSNSYVDTCINAGNISMAEFVAGICANGGNIRCCINYGDITGVALSHAVAGISIYPSGCSYISKVTNTVTGCVNSGKVSAPVMSASCSVAGVSTGGSATNCINAGCVSGSNADTVVGVSTGTTTRCINVAQVTGTGSSVYAVHNGASTNSFYDSQMCTVADYASTGATAKTTTEMCGSALRTSLLLANFVFENNMYPRVKGIANKPASLAISSPVFLENNEKVTYVDTNFTMGGCSNHDVKWSLAAGTALSIDNTNCTADISSPGLPNLCAAVGDTVYKVVPLQVKMDALIIKNATELVNFRNGINDYKIFYYNPSDSTFHAYNDPNPNYIRIPLNGEGATFRVSADINLGGMEWTPIANYGSNNNTSFKGTFDGANHTISNFVLANRSHNGLFGRTQDALITNLKVDNVRGSSIIYSYVGALAGALQSTTVTYCEISNVNISTSEQYLGAMAGSAASTHVRYCTVCNNILTNSYTSSAYVGGFIGHWSGTTLTNSKVARNTITSSGNYVGGFAGFMTQSGVKFTLNDLVSDTCIIQGKSYVGGFAGQHSWSHGGSLERGHIRGGSVTGTGDYVGGFCGLAGGLGIHNSSNSANVVGVNVVGGFVGRKQGANFQYNKNMGDVTGNNYVGGLIGQEQTAQYPAQILYSVNVGRVKGNNYVGGLRGYAYHTSTDAATQSTNLGEVEGNMYVGGIVGWSQGKTSSNINAAKVSGNNYVGGIVGYQSNYPGYSRSANNSIHVGQVYGTSNVGNVAGYYEDGTLTNCYYDKQISPDYMGIGSSGTDVAGVAVGKNTSEMLNTTLTMSNFTASAGLYPRPNAIKDSIGAHVAASPVNLTNNKTAFTIPGNDTYTFTPSATNGVVWTCEETALLNNNGTFNPKAAGGDVLTAAKGDVAKHLNVTVGLSKEFPCIIKNQAELTKFTQYINSGITFYYNTSAADQNPETFTNSEPENFLTGIKINPGGEAAFFKLADDFNPDFQTESWEGPVGTSAHPFLGDFNGNGRTVSYLPSATANYSGFFGVNKGTIYNLTIENSNMSANSYNYVGALCGYNENGTITNCHVVNGTVAGAQYVGGLVGYNKGYIEDCHNSSNVEGTQYVGGIAGRSTKAISRCFNLGDIAASGTTTYLGGVVGFAEDDAAALTYCYNAGRVTATGSSSKFVGGVVGDKTDANFGNCYNIGEVSAPTTASNTGALAGRVANTLVNTVAYDNQMCTIAGAYGTGNGNATSAATSAMLGTALQGVLGNDGTWTYTEGLYPRLTSMKDMEASVAAATPMHIAEGENVANVEHEFSVSTDNSVVWTVEPETGVLDMSNFPTINFIRCGTPELSVKQGTEGKEIKKVKISINYTASEVEYDTVCGGGFFHWPVNGLDYYATNDVVYNAVEDGCPVTHILHVTIPAELAAEVATVDQQCYNTNTGQATATVTGGFGKYSYSWKDEHGDEVSTTNPATGLAPGTYSLTVTDGKPVPKNPGDEYCTVTVEDIVINPVTELVARIDTFSAGCYNTDDGMFQISVEGGVAPYTVSWNNGAGSRFLNTPQENYEVNNLADGTYNVIVTDANGCTKTEGLTINLTENATVYKITAYSDSKTYDGDALEAGKFSLKIGSGEAVPYLSGNSITLASGDVLTATVEQGSLTDAGEYSNSVTSYSVTRHGQDVTCLYNIDVEHGMVSIAKRHVTLTSADSVAFLPLTSSDGCLRQHKVTVSGEGFAAADQSQISYNYTGAICDGHAAIIPNTFTVNWGNVNPDNYDVTYNYGTLTLVENGKLVVKALNMEKTYDGVTTIYGQTSYSIAAYTVLENVGGSGVNDTIFYNTPDNTTLEVNGRTYTVVVVLNGGSDITMTDADTVDNVVTSVHVYEGTGTSHDITSSFTGGVVMENGVLQINPIEITLTSYGDTWTYDAQLHSRPGVSMEGAFLPEDISVAPAASREETNAGTYPNTITYTTTAHFNARNYKVQKNEGNLVINQRPLYLKGVEKLVDVTGDWQETTEFTYGNLVAGHTASGISYLARGKEIGNYTGVFSGTLQVLDGSSNDVTANYTPVEQPSFLGIQSPEGEIKMKSATKSQMYDGTAITAQTYEVSFKGVRINPMSENNKYFKLSTGDTLVIVPVNDGLTGLVDAGDFTNDFDWDIKPAAHKVNYNEYSLEKGTVTVTKRPVILTSNALTRTYDGTDIVSEGVTVSGNGFVGEEGATYTYESFAIGSRTNAGTYANKFYYTLKSGTKAANYEIDTVYGKLIVTPAVLTVKADDKTRPYGDANAFTYTITGYQHGEDESVIIAGLDDVTYLCDGDQFANIGTYTITPVVDALVSQNYSFTTATGTLTVQKRQMKVTANSITVPYDGTAHN